MIERLEQLLHAECSSHILPFLWMKGEDTLTIREEIDKIEECGIKEICLSHARILILWSSLVGNHGFSGAGSRKKRDEAVDLG